MSPTLNSFPQNHDPNSTNGSGLPYTHILWDWNGTLMDDIHLCIDCTNIILRARQLPDIDIEIHHALFDFPISVYYERLGIDLAEEDFPAINQVFSDAYEKRREECPLHPNTHETLSNFQRAGFEQSILSAYPQQTLEEIVDFYGLSPFFKRLFGHHRQMGEGKIDQGRECMADLGAPPEKVLLIGDTMHDHEIAQALGIDCILLSHGHHSHERLLKCGVPVHESLESLQINFFKTEQKN